VDGPRPDLITRAARFDTTAVAANLAATLRALHGPGNGPAAWLSRALWADTFQADASRADASPAAR
jgi:hypothetical protein